MRIDSSDWTFVDLRIDIPPNSFGSDAANPHTQYSNAVAILHDSVTPGIGASFTLGEGNDYLCRAAQYLITELSGLTVGDIIDSEAGIYESLANPRQLRWLSPYAGLPMMAAGLIMNTLLDAASKRCGLPAWEYLSNLPTNDLISLFSLRHLNSAEIGRQFQDRLDSTLPTIVERCKQLRASGVPVYHTTWKGHSAREIARQMRSEIELRGIRHFKIKIGPDIASDLEKLQLIRQHVSTEIAVAVDANQTLTFDGAKEWLQILSENNVLWLEEPFAPDNVDLFDSLSSYRRRTGLSCEIATGENCPNPHTAAALMSCGVDRFQSDPCRMMGLVDGAVTALLAKHSTCSITPHAGGAGLDELSPHLQLFNLARVDSSTDPTATLTENVGFCSRLYSNPTIVTGGLARTPTAPGLLVGYSPDVERRIQDYRDGISWLEF